jgi:predicted ArsR family transcriptional regulator
MVDKEGGRSAPPAPAVAEPIVRSQTKGQLQRQARALGHPTRFEIFRFVADAPGPVRVATLAEQFRFNPSAIRQHLAKLCDARLLIEELGSGSRTGRPPLQYRLAPAAMGTWGSAGPYELLALLLLEVAKGGSPVEAGARAGRDLAATHDSQADPVAVIESEMARRGFEPRREDTSTSLELVLERCPFEAAALADPDVVCQIHRGLAEGILSAMGSDLSVSELVAHDPRQAGCRLRMKAVPGSAGQPRQGEHPTDPSELASRRIR